MKLIKGAVGLVVSSALVFPLSVSAAKEGTRQEDIKVFLDGKQMSFEAAPIIVDGTTLVPLRAIFSALGAEVTWNNEKHSVSAKKEDVNILLTIGEKKASKNGKPIPLNTPSVIHQSTTYVPLRFVSEALGTLVGWNKNSNSVSISSDPLEEYVVKRVIDGDTIEVVDKWAGIETVRLIGVDTPESVPTGPIEYYGKEASEYTKTHLTGKTVYIASDHKDSYGRTLGYVYMLDGTFYNALLPSEGYATVMTVEPDVKWSAYFTFVESQAKQKSLGLWNNEKNQANADMKKYFVEKSKEFGFKEGEFNSGQFITRDLVARMIVTSMFPKTKYVFVANTLIDVSQQDWFQYYVGVLIQEGVIELSDLNSGMFEPDRPVTYGEYKKMITNALLGDENTDLKLTDFNLFQDNIDDGQLMTMGEALVVTDKASKVLVPLRKYFDSLKAAATNSDTLESLTKTLNNEEITAKVGDLKEEFTKINFDSIQKKSASIFNYFLQALKEGSWKDIVTITKIRSVINNIENNISDAAQYLKEAKDATN